MMGGVEGVGGAAIAQRSRDIVQVTIDGKTVSTYVTIMPLPEKVNALIG